jgi:methyl-accepting chemotaxis protein
VRLELAHKFVLGILLAVAVAIAAPPLLEASGVSPWGAAFAALGAGAVLGWLLSQQIARNFKSLRECTDRISRGNLTAEVGLSGGRWFPDETVDLARSVQLMLESLRELVLHVQRAADQVAQASRELSPHALAVNGANQEIAGTMNLVAASAVRQQENLGRVSERVREIADAIRENASAAREAAGFAREASERATSGVDGARLAIERMQSLFLQAEQAEQLVLRLDGKIHSVHRINELITSVAEKTHLLSLNASIEEAHAGDAGRGFSVVAEEIRKLAESAGGSAEQIGALIAQVEEESARVSEVMRAIGQHVTDGRENLGGIVESLSGIQRAVQEAARRAEVIVHKGDGQVGKTERVVTDVDEVASEAADNARASQDTRRGLARQLEAMEKMVRQAVRLTETSEQLDELARRFRTR